MIICPGCNYDYDYLEFRVKTPTAFRTNFSEGQDALEDFEIVRSTQEIHKAFFGRLAKVKSGKNPHGRFWYAHLMFWALLA